MTPPYEGLHCLICGEETGAHDLCVPCAVRSLDAERRREAMSQWED